MEKAKILFKNGETIEAEINGNCFIVNEKPVFPIDLSEVKITKDEVEENLYNIKIIEVAALDDKYWFTLRELTMQELKDIKTQADIQYLAMMSDIEL